MSDFTTPPRRPAPEELRQRISADLTAARARDQRRGQVLAPVAAALVLLAAAGGVVGVNQLNGQQDVVPIDRPSPSAPSSTTTTRSTSPSASPTSTGPAMPETMGVRAMSNAEIRRDTTSCLKVGVHDQPFPRRGTMRTRYAAVQPVLSNDITSLSQRVLILQDDRGQYQCIDGDRESWMTVSSDEFAPTAKVPGAEVPNSGGGVSANCGTVAESQIRSSVLLGVDVKRVAAAEVTLVSGGRAVRVVDVPVAQATMYVAVRFSGTATRRPMSFRVELHDAQGHVLTVMPYGSAGTKPAQHLSFALQSCTDMEKWQNEHQPKPLTRPGSDRAGIATCRKLVKQNGDQDLDLDRASAKVTVSTATEWGTVLSDGRHALGCSLFPTKEISRAVPVTQDPALSKKLFFWATNPMVPDGQSLWAAGHLPGATRIAYTLPDGTSATAKISPDGYWMVKAHTATTFDSEDNTSDWKPVTVTVTRNSRTGSYAIPWTAQATCNQISHGC